MAAEGFLTALGALFNALFLVGGVYIYISLARQISARTVEAEFPAARSFGLGDAILAAALITLFLLNAAGSSSPAGEALKSTPNLVANALISIGLLVFVASFLKFRGLDLNSLGGFSKIGFWRTLGTGTILLFAAYPLIVLADAITRRFWGESSSRQEIVELFNGSQTLEQRILIILLAVTVAPAVEEFVFRFFLYGVLKRYFGRALGIAANALLFGLVHAHLPSFVPLFVLGTCFTLAYEWSGSILVSMTMHALFNSLTLIALAFPEFFPQ